MSVDIWRREYCCWASWSRKCWNQLAPQVRALFLVFTPTIPRQRHFLRNIKSHVPYFPNSRRRCYWFIMMYMAQIIVDPRDLVSLYSPTWIPYIVMRRRKRDAQFALSQRNLRLFSYDMRFIWQTSWRLASFSIRFSTWDISLAKYF